MEIRTPSGETVHMDDASFYSLPDNVVIKVHKAIGYAYFCFQGKTVFLHKFITSTSSQEVDHANGNRLDCRKSNLRLCTRAENNRNKAVGSNNKSGYKGVKKDPRNGRWLAKIYPKNGKEMHLGSFGTPEEAAEAYNLAALKYYGTYARLNSVKSEKKW